MHGELHLEAQLQTLKRNIKRTTTKAKHAIVNVEIQTEVFHDDSPSVAFDRFLIKADEIIVPTKLIY